MPIERKLAAIMFTDIAGCTAQMSKDEAVALSLLNKKESVLKPLIKEHNGTYVKSTGDGSLSHFKSAVDATMCAKKLQESIYDDKNLNVRIGVHLGDTIFEKDGDIRGEGVNIAGSRTDLEDNGLVAITLNLQLSSLQQLSKMFSRLEGVRGIKSVTRIDEFQL